MKYVNLRRVTINEKFPNYTHGKYKNSLNETKGFVCPSQINTID
jgi:hypothetical protein